MVGRRRAQEGGRHRPQGRRRAGGRLRAYLFAGILVTAPIAITLYIAWFFISSIDDGVAAFLPPRLNPETWLPFSIPGLGFLMLVVVLTLIGALTAGILGRMLVRASERVLERIPAVRSVYGAVKQIFETVLANRSEAFSEVVLLEYPRRGMWVVGFVTGVSEGELQQLTEDLAINVFVPTTPNPTSGFLVFVPRGDLIVLPVTVEEGIKMVVSAGIVTPPAQGAPAGQDAVAAPEPARG